MPGDIGQMSKYGAFKKSPYHLRTVFIDSHFVPWWTKKPENASIFWLGIKKAPLRRLIMVLGPRFELGTTKKNNEKTLPIP